MNKEQKENIRQGAGEAILCTALVMEELKLYLAANPINPEDKFDLNIHLVIEHICQYVADKVSQDTPCNKEYVMLYWLTNLVYGKKVN